MAGFNGTGTWVRVHDWSTDLTNAIPVTASRMDAEHDAIATGLSTTICRDGQSTTTARIPFAQGTSAIAGSTSAVSYAQTNDLNTGLYFPGTDQWGLVAGGTATLVSTATALTATGTLTVSGAVTLSSSLGLTGDLAINTDKFSVTASSGNTTMAGTLAVTGAATLSSTLAVTGNVAVNTDKFTVTAASGNTAVGGTLAVTGAATLSSILGVTGNVAVNTDKFTVAASSGNTAVAGTLAVTGASTLTGSVTANNSAGVTARNTIKAFGKVVNGSLVAGFNVASITDNGSSHTVTFTNAMANTNYAIMLTGDRDNVSSGEFLTWTYHTVATGSFRIEAGLDGTSGNLDPDSYSFMVLSNE